MGKLRVELAQKFIDRTVGNLNFNINIMNEKGIIIASKDTSRVGDFHQVAYNLLNGKMVSGVIKKEEEEKYINTKAGVNMFIDHKNDHVGVICVTGNPDEVESFAELVKASMEIMLDYELQEKDKRRKKNDIEQFIYYVLFDENIEVSKVSNMSKNINFAEGKERVIVIIKNDSELSNDKIIQKLQKAEGFSAHDLVGTARNEDIILFKYFGLNENSEEINFKESLESYFSSFYKSLPKIVKPEEFSIYVGTPQNRLDQYRLSHNKTCALYNNGRYQGGIFFLSDHLMDYYRSIIRNEDYYNTFSTYLKFFDAAERKILAETVHTLNKNNYNVVNSAKELFIHRNTLVFRLNKYKRILGIDPILNSSDRDFLNELGYFFEIYKEQEK